ncbi:siderophore ABC transporter substrate-binding protein [Alkalicoccus luteus]|uniref:Siderophore ABC transporter substrate-binding protein n=1 Tax=Alkalicoccus luteus TaxID=1237094 RepID=A0A969TV43_9BACI|nr:siderophore ABC transporter substrate-binding protein [Alkalicoccus luteus]NJP38020.1 siderophore ABC transporter substrate-binding protein [Alkalicoccus luteus]
MKKRTTASLFAGALLLAACTGEGDANQTDNAEAAGNNGQNETEEVNDANAGDEAESITVTHDLGETEVPVNPESVVVFDFGVLDTMDVLGEEPVALPQGNVPSYLSDYESEAYENAGTLFEPDFEAIYAMEPDLILIGGRTAEAYDELSEIAPTVMMGVDQDNYIESFEEQVTLLGDIFAKEDEAASALTDVQQQLDELQQTDFNGSGLMVMTSEGSLSAYGPGSRFGLLHNEFEITPADEGIDDANHGQNVSFEYVLETNPDILFVLDRGAVVGGEEEDSADEVLNNDIINQTQAAENDSIVYLNTEYWYISAGGLTSVSGMIEEVRQAVE